MSIRSRIFLQYTSSIILSVDMVTIQSVNICQEDIDIIQDIKITLLSEVFVYKIQIQCIK